jgi:hypothetical protein
VVRGDARKADASLMVGVDLIEGSDERPCIAHEHYGW